MEEKRQGEYLPVFEDERGTYIMSSRDLCMIDHLPLLAEAGIDSFKIEGRMKGINYVAGVVKSYREAVDAIGREDYAGLCAGWREELSRSSNRGFTTGMFFGKQSDTDYNFDEESYRMSHELVGVVLDVQGNRARVALRNRLDRGDEVEFLSSGLEGKRFEVASMDDPEGFAITSARNEEIIFLEVPAGVRKHDLIRRDKDFRGSKKVIAPVAGDRDC